MKMNLSDELSKWRFKEITVNLYISECVTIYESIVQFIKEYRDNRRDFFRESFISQISIKDLSLAHEFFLKLKESNSEMQELANLKEEEKRRNENYSFDSFNDEDPFGSELFKKMGEFSLKNATITIELLPLLTALRVSEAYTSELTYKNNQEASLLESNDWSPPSNFAHGTDIEKEIWEDFQRSQSSKNSR